MRKRPEYDRKLIGYNLRRLRESGHFSVEEVRQYLCLGSVQAVYKYENGASYPPADTLLALMELYGAELKDIIAGQEAAGEADLVRPEWFDIFPADVARRRRVILLAGYCKWYMRFIQKAVG